MQRKQAEADFANMMGRMRITYENAIWCHKWADMRACPHCGQLLYKVEDNVDYTIVIGNVAGLVECKQDPERFYYSDDSQGIRPGQREWLSEWTLQNRFSWLFLELGDGRAPDDRNAWLIPWHWWLAYETLMEDRGMKSLPWRPNRSATSKEINAIELLHDSQLLWVPTKGFTIPVNHSFWLVYGDQIIYKEIK